MKMGVKVVLGVVGAFVVLQVVPVERTNPPVTGEVQAPADVKAVLKRACWDCHSNETVWPWYSRVAPVSFVVRHHVEDGRKHLNFSEWSGYTPERRAKKQAEAWEEVEEGEMPMKGYVAVHAAAQLSEADRKVLEAWAKGPVSN